MATGDQMVLGESNVADNVTTLAMIGANPQCLTVLSDGPGKIAVLGGVGATSSEGNIGVWGQVDGQQGVGVRGLGGHIGVLGESHKPQSAIGPVPVEEIGVFGASQTGVGVFGTSSGSNGVGVTGSSDFLHGVVGKAGVNVKATGEKKPSPSAAGVWGESEVGRGVRAKSISNVGLAATSESSYAIAAQSGSGVAVLAKAFLDVALYAKSNSDIAVYAWSPSSIGVFAHSTSQAGVQGQSETSAGVYGHSTSSHGVVGNSSAQAAGTAGVYGWALKSGWGVFGKAQAGIGVDGYSETGIGVQGRCNSSTGYAGFFHGDVYVEGNFTKTGMGSCVAVPFKDGSLRRLCSIESPESWFEDFGEGKLVGGKAKVVIDADFASVVEGEYHIILTPYGDSNGLYVSVRTQKSFEVREQKGGKSTLTFSYRVVAKRRGYARHRFEKVTPPPKNTEPSAPNVEARRSRAEPFIVTEAPPIPGVPE